MTLRAVKIWLLGSTGIGFALLAWGWWALALPGGAPATITYLDADRREIASFLGQNGRVQIWVPLDRIPPSVVAAVVAAEDRRFASHRGRSARGRPGRSDQRP
jgi:membrane peptidoglycan carboxypeptidase